MSSAHHYQSPCGDPRLANSSSTTVRQRADELVALQEQALFKRTNYLFSFLLLAEWIVGIALALIVSPYTWIGDRSQVHLHVWLATLLGGVISIYPAYACFRNPTRPLNRFVLTGAQMITCALWVHLTGGRLETHFFYFGSIAFAAVYRDWRVVLSTTLFVALDHFLRGVLWPLSVYGILAASPWRSVEHAIWVLFEDIVLIWAIHQSRQEMNELASRQAKLESVNELIETKVAERTDQLRKASDAAEAASRAKAEFLATMSHEIRTPMNGVIGMTGLLLETELMPEQRDFAQTIRSSGEALLGIVNDILDFSKIESGKLELEETELDVRALVEEVAEMFVEAAAAKNLELACLVQNDVPPFLHGDVGRIRQILANLANNAIKFTQKGEVSLQASCEGHEDGKARIRFEVKDTGIGISKETAARLFQPFTQADASTTRKYGGTGLGLAVSSRLTQLMGGTLGVESDPGKGSTFIFKVSLKPSEQVRAPTTLPAVRAEFRGKRVLVVDDNATNRKVLQHYLHAWEMRIEQCEGAEAALGLLRTAAASGEPFDVLLTDLQMPEMDGFALAAALKGDPLIAGTPILLLSSLGERGFAAAVKEAGVAGYLSKPIRKSQLRRHLAALFVPNDGRQVIGVTTEKQSNKSQRSELRGRLLIAEDNAVNQKVAARTLEKLGFRADVVANGLEAIEAVKQIPYNAILMDCFMPECSGFEATMRIRKWEGPQKHAVIIALTASAMEGDREKCLAAGMDDYLSKPFKASELEAVLRKWSVGVSAVSPVST